MRMQEKHRMVVAGIDVAGIENLPVARFLVWLLWRRALQWRGLSWWLDTAPFDGEATAILSGRNGGRIGGAQHLVMNDTWLEGGDLPAAVNCGEHQQRACARLSIVNAEADSPHGADSGVHIMLPVEVIHTKEGTSVGCQNGSEPAH